MDKLQERNIKPWKKALCVFLSLIMALGTFVTLTVGSSRLQDWLGIKSMLSAYAAEIVDTAGAIAVDEEAMLADNTVIDLENRDGSNTVYLFSEPISYTDENGNLKTKDISVEKQSDKELKNQGYGYTNGQNDYRINFSEDLSKGVYAQFGDFAYTIRPVTEYSVSGEKSTSVFLNEEFETFAYENLYGNGTSLRFYPQLNGVKDEIVLNQNINKNSFSFELKTENCTALLNDDGSVSLISNDDKSAVQTFSAPYAYDCEYIEGDVNEHYTDCEYSLEITAENTYILTVTVSKEWLESESTVYPIIIDPTTSNISDSADAGVYSAKSTTNYGSEITACFGRASEYGYGRALVKFTVPSAILKGATISSAYFWARETTGRTTSTYVRPYLNTSTWSESAVTWSKKPNYDSSSGMTRKNINSKSSDNANSPYWYKFNLASAVKKWVDGTKTNYGVSFISEEETNKEYNWRAFATKNYSTSSYRPYTVITYTNDTTAPTITNVTGNPTAWTKGNVTLTVNGAADNSGGAGLSSTPYSFSTTKGSYSWQSANTKTFSSNCTVYVYVRDALNNIRLVSTQTISKIDKTAPTATSVNGNSAGWTNNDITLTVKGAADSQSGLNGTAYSFSASEGVYNWISDNSKTFTENQTVYIYVRDAVGNIALVDTLVIDKIDKNKPAAPIITGNDNEWSGDTVTLRAESTDEGSGIAEYSFSTSEGEYNWSNENSAPFEDSSTVYVYSKDNAGNISDVSTTIIKVDREAPTGVVTGDSSEWTKSVTLTVDEASDELSGLNVEAYSFSTAEGEYSWQESNSKSFTANGTVYVYVRDAVDNVSLIDTVVIDKIDRSAPVINNIDTDSNGGQTAIKVDAEDTVSGIALYSFDNGATWQESNEYTFETDTYNYMFVKVKDNAGNISSKRYDFYIPQIYQENGRIVLYNPNPKCESKIYYRTSLSLTSKWTEYSKPITATGKIYVTFAEPVNQSVLLNYHTITIPEETYSAGKYEESDIDTTFTYKNLSFNFSRAYDNENNNWFFSINSNIKLDEERNIVTAVMPDGSEINLLPKSVDLYYNVFNNYEFHIIRNENNSVKSYTLIAGDIYYNYDSDGVLVSVSDKYDDELTFDWSYRKVTVSDSSGREYVAKLDSDNNILSITNPADGIIEYTYDNDKLVCVTDETGITLSEYQYDESGRVSKSGDCSITYDTQSRVAGILKDNGYLTEFEYSENSIYITQSNEDNTSITYDNFGRILSSTDKYGDITEYTYDDVYGRLTKVSKNDTVESEYIYNGELPYNTENHMLYSRSDSDSTVYYYYDENNNVIKSCEDFKDSSSIDTYTYYVYDDFGNVTLQAKYLTNNYGSEPLVYDPEAEYDSVVEYEYDNGLLVRTNDIDNNTVVMYTYDVYGNVIKTTTMITEDEQTSVTVSDSTYDILGRITYEKSEDSEITYTYDAAGRLLLTDADGEYCRTVYDEKGRTVQEIYGDDYNPELDNLPYEYGDKTVGSRYEYDTFGNLVKEINENDLITEYAYSAVGTLYRKSFDIYDFYYKNNGSCDKIDVSGETIVDYEYKVDDSDISTNSDQFINRITYADGYTEEQKTDKYGNVLSKLADGNIFYNISSPAENKIVYYDNEIKHRNVIESSDSGYTFTQQKSSLAFIFSYITETAEDVTTITQTHFSDEKQYQTVIDEDSVTYTSPTSGFVYTTGSDGDLITETIRNGDTAVLSSAVSYDEDDNIFRKSYAEYNLSYSNTYDENGNITADESNQYTYDTAGELISVTGGSNSSYTYDERGNILSKTVSGETTAFSYNTDEWKDQLVSVNGEALTYDSNGNLISYDGKEYTWSHGKRLASVTAGEDKYYYSYDSSGIRTSKTVNGECTTFDVLNGKVLTQYSDTEKICFQYNNDTPIGFILNDVQYFYLTDLSGDVTGITDAQGNLIATYAYDEWGKLLSIETAEEDNAEQLEIAEANPLRYRGYYYDNETGMYYLQSRYYNPELCRFISADSFDYISNDMQLNLNAYAYCWNCPVAYDDIEGTKPELSINLADIISFIKNINNKIKEGITAGKEKLNKLFENWTNSIKTHYNAFIDKLEYFINYPDAVINNTLSKIFNREINIRFRLVEFIREKLNVSISLSKLKADVESEHSSNVSSRKISFDFAEDEKTDNWLVAALKVLTLAFQVDTITGIFEGIVQIFKPSFDFNKWFENLSETSQDVFSQISLGIAMLFNKIYSSAKDLLDFNKLSDILKNKAYSEIGEFIFESFTSLGGDFFSLWENFADVFNGYTDGTYRGSQGLAVFLLNASILAISIYFPGTSATNVLLTTIITNAILNFEIDFENGHFWG